MMCLLNKLLIIFILLVSSSANSNNEANFLVIKKCENYVEKWLVEHERKNDFQYSFESLRVNLEAYGHIAGIGKLKSSTLSEIELASIIGQLMNQCFPRTNMEVDINSPEAAESLLVEFYRAKQENLRIHGVKIEDGKVKIYLDSK